MLSFSPNAPLVSTTRSINICVISAESSTYRILLIFTSFIVSSSSCTLIASSNNFAEYMLNIARKRMHSSLSVVLSPVQVCYNALFWFFNSIFSQTTRSFPCLTLSNAFVKYMKYSDIYLFTSLAFCNST